MKRRCGCRRAKKNRWQHEHGRSPERAYDCGLALYNDQTRAHHGEAQEGRAASEAEAQGEIKGRDGNA
jgi:hypothetical protein